jgi:hypothetical protein
MSERQMSSELVFDALRRFINERPNLDPANYGCDPKQLNYTQPREWRAARNAMRQDARTIAKDGTRARKALAEAQQYPLNVELLAESFKRAFSGRLEWDEYGELNYCIGQYYPTEYRAAAAAVLEHYIHLVKPKFLPPDGQIFYSAADIEQAASRAGSHFFDKSAKRFFRSRILPDAWHGNGGVYFVTSEQFEGSDGRQARRGYTVRVFNPKDGDVGTFGPFNEMSKYKARMIARIASEYPDAALEAMGCKRDGHGVICRVDTGRMA